MSNYPSVTWKFNLIGPFDGPFLVQRVQENLAQKDSLPSDLPVTDPFKVNNPFEPKTATKDYNADTNTWTARSSGLIYILTNQTILARPTTKGFGSELSATPNVILIPANP